MAKPPVTDPLRPDGRRRRSKNPQDPIVAELFSVERLEQHARTLAAAQKVTGNPRRGQPVRPRVAENGQILLDVVPDAGAGHQGRTLDHARRRVAGRQLPDRR